MTELAAAKYFDRTTPPHITTLVLLSGLSALSMNVFLPSLPNMTAFFHTDYATMQLSVSLYLGLTGLLQLFIGPLSDRYGRRPIILSGISVFLLATVGCILATTVEMFLLFRMIQTTIAIGLVLSRAIVRDIVPASQAASMIGYVTMGMALVPMVAPAAGGYLNDLFGWQANFTVLLVMGVIVAVVLWYDLGETNIHRSSSLTVQVKTYPELLRSRRFWGYALTAAFSSGSFFAFLGGAPYVGTYVFDLPASQLGIYFGFVSVGYIVGNFISGRYSARIGLTRMMLWGTYANLFGVAMSIVALLAGFDTPLSFFGFMVFIGLGNGMVLPNSNAGLVSVRPRLAGSASGLGGSIQMAGGATLATVAGAILNPHTGAYPLLLLMGFTAVMALGSIFYIMRVDRQAGPLDGPEI